MTYVPLTLIGALCAIVTYATTLYATPLCGHTKETVSAQLFYRDRYCTTCDDARRFLYREGISFREFDADNPEVMRRLVDGEGRGVLPAIHICGTWYFGFDDRIREDILSLFITPA